MLLKLYQRYRPLIGQFIRFALIGIFNTGIDYGIYYVLTRYVGWFDGPYGKEIAQSIAFIVAATNSYFMNKYITFKDKSKQVGVQYLKFFAVSAIGFGLNLLFFTILLRFGLFDIVAKVLTTGVVLFWNFLANKFWTFKQKITPVLPPSKK